MLTKVDILSKNYLFLLLYSLLFSHTWLPTTGYWHRCKYWKFIKNSSQSMEFPNFELYPFSTSSITKRSRAGHLSIAFGVKIIISLWKYIFDLKQFALSYSFQYWLFPNSQYGKMNTNSRIQHPTTSFSLAKILRMVSGMPCINKYSLLTY